MALEKLLEESPEAYYWAGFIMADGTFFNGQLKVHLGIKDKNHIARLANILNANMIDSFATCLNKRYEYTGFTKCDSLNIHKVLSKFNFNKNKTLNPPLDLIINNDDMFISFLLGFIDGDGSIKKDGSLCVGCHKNWQDILTLWFRRAFSISGCQLYNKSMKIPTAYIANKRPNLANIIIYNHEFLWFLKDKASELNLPILIRKWDRIKKIETYSDKNSQYKKILNFLNDGKDINWISKAMNTDTSNIDHIRRVVLQRFTQECQTQNWHRCGNRKTIF